MHRTLLEERYNLSKLYNNNREFIQCFQTLKAPSNLKKNVQHANTHIVYKPVVYKQTENINKDNHTKHSFKHIRTPPPHTHTYTNRISSKLPKSPLLSIPQMLCCTFHIYMFFHPKDMPVQPIKMTMDTNGLRLPISPPLSESLSLMHMQSDHAEKVINNLGSHWYIRLCLSVCIIYP